MKILKDDKYQSILQAARKEFIHKGYKDASMRKIAKEANVGLSNIYNYFKNKDEIFLAVVKPARDDLFTFVTRQHSEKSIDFDKIAIWEYQEESIDLYIRLIHTYEEELRLLLFHAEGSSLRNFRNELTNHLTQVNYSYMELVKKYYPHAQDISDFFVHAMNSWMVSILGEIVMHKLERDKIRSFFREYFRFEMAGWLELTGL